MSKNFWRLLLTLVMLSGLALGGSVYQKTREGNRLWLKGKYQDAFTNYVEASAQAKGPAEPILHFDAGDALYKQERYEEALKEFEQAQAGDNKQLKEKAFYNSGNCYFRTGIAQKSIDLLKKAAESYQKALELDPNDQEAKHNLEVVRRHIQLENQKPPPQSSQQNQPQNQNQQKQNERQKQEAGPKEQEQKKQNEQEQQQQQQQQAGKPRELSREEAERILKSFSEQEKEQMKELMRAQSMNAPSGKDW